MHLENKQGEKQAETRAQLKDDAFLREIHSRLKPGIENSERRFDVHKVSPPPFVAVPKHYIKFKLFYLRVVRPGSVGPPHCFQCQPFSVHLRRFGIARLFGLRPTPSVN